ncbi:phage tail tape measure protein [Flammeovirga sp. OC4]|uniref:phage tail tape measure protein n=1 Tax=Flammeovirga sp. OC4 TaxID=1382345 RepID=UPI000693D23C|nr:phage tail tape measure protein [Flammeovirga sp. OC4]
MAGGKLVVRVGANLKDFERSMQRLSRRMERMTRDIKETGEKMTLALSVPIVAFAADTAKAAAEFDTAMSRVGVLSAATGKDLESLTAKARELGGSTVYSAKEVAQAMGYLAQAGFNAQQQFDSVAGVLDLATAGATDLARASDIASDILTGFGKSASEINDVNDVLVGTFTKTNTSLETLYETMKYVAPVATSAGLSIEEMSAAAGILGNNAIKGSQAGTGLRTIISRLIDPPKEAAAALEKLGVEFGENAVKSKGLIGIFQDLQNKGATTTDIFRIFGREASSSATVLLKSADEYSKFATELENVGGIANKVATGSLSPLERAWKSMQSAFQEFQLIVANSGLTEFATSLLNNVSGLIKQISKLNPVILKWGSIIAGVTALMGPLLLAISGMITFLPQFLAGISVLTGAFSTLSGLLVTAAGSMMALVSSFTILGTSVGIIAKSVIDSFSVIGNFIRKTLLEIEFEFLLWESNILRALDSFFQKINKLSSVIGGPQIRVFDENQQKALGEELKQVHTALQDIGDLTFDDVLVNMADSVDNSFDYLFGGVETKLKSLLADFNRNLFNGGSPVAERPEGGESGGSLSPSYSQMNLPSLEAPDKVALFVPEKLTEEQLKNLQKLEAQVQKLEESTLNSFSAMGKSMIDNLGKGEEGFKSFFKSVAKIILDLIANYATQAMAGLAAKEIASKGLFGLITAGTGIGVVQGMFSGFSGQIDSFASGGISGENSVYRKAEGGQREMSLPINRITSVLGNTGSNNGIDFQPVSDTDLYRVVKKAEERENRTLGTSTW